MTGSISVSGLLGGTAGQIDVTSLISSLMQAASVPKSQLQDKQTAVTAQLSAYQAINTRLSAVQAAAATLQDPTTWNATTANSSSSAVVATSTAGAAAGSTTFDVRQLAAAQVSIVTAGADGTVLSTPSAGFTVTGADGTAHTVTPASGSAADVATAVNAAGLGVRAAVVTTDQGTVLQLSSARTGVANGFAVAGLDSAAQTVVTAQDARVAVGGSAGYTVSSPSNTFSNVIPGVSFSVGAVASGVTVTVAADPASIAKAVQNLVTATNAAHAELSNDTAKGAVLQGSYDARTLTSAIVDAVAKGTGSGGSLRTYGLDVDQTGAMTFDAAAFTAAYAADAKGTQAAVSTSFAGSLAATSTGAVDTTTGSIAQSIKGLTTTSSDLDAEIAKWTDRLTDIQSSLQTKYTVMQTTLAKLQSQQTYLTSMFKSLSSSSDSSS